MSGPSAVLQVVILRDGLLVGTEIFAPGQYSVGSAPAVDLHLEDPAVQPSHAALYFQNGRAAIQDAGTGALFVNGHRVNACEVRAVDEVAIGPFTLKLRVMAQRPAAQSASAAEVAALFNTPAPGAGGRPAAPANRQPSTTVVSSRRMTAAPAVPERQLARHLRPVAVEPAQETQAVDMAPHLETIAPDDLVGDAAPLFESEELPATREAPRAAMRSLQPPTAPPIPDAPARSRAAHGQHDGRGSGGKAVKSARSSGRKLAPAIPSANGTKGKPLLFVELYWGETRKVACAYRTFEKQRLIARPDDDAPLPLWGFSVDEDFLFAEQQDDVFRVYVPDGAAAERRANDGNFYPVKRESLEVGESQRRCLTLGSGHALRLSSGANVTLVAYVQPALPRPFVNPLSGLPWLMLACLTVLMGAFFSFAIIYSDGLENPDFNAKGLTPAAVKLVAPPKPEEKKKLEEKVEKLTKKPEKKKEKERPEPKVEKPKVNPETKKVLKTVEKLVASGPAMKDLLAAVDKLGSGPGSKMAKNDFKLSGLIGKQPIAAAGLGTFGLGGGGGGGVGIKGLEMLRGKGGGGIGALGAGNIGKGAVAGTVTHAVSRNVGAQGSIDKEAVAKVINSHLSEVSGCYERALLKTPGLAGKIVLEWQITTTGSVGLAKTKSSTMQSPAVEGCILTALKGWHFPAAKGAGVLITYPFMFNSVGY